MDGGRIFPEGYPTHEEIDSLRGIGFRELTRAVTLADLRRAGPAVQISSLRGAEWTSVHGQPAAGRRKVPHRLARHWPRCIIRESVRLSDASVTDGDLARSRRRACGERQLRCAVRSSSGTLSRFRSGLPHILGLGSTRVYIDQHSGQLLAILGPGRRAYDWVFYAVHTLKFPGLLWIIRTSGRWWS